MAERREYLMGTKPGAEDVGQPIRDFMGIKPLENYVAAQVADHDLFKDMDYD